MATPPPNQLKSQTASTIPPRVKPSTNVIRPLSQVPTPPRLKPISKKYLVIFLIVFAGLATGYFLSTSRSSSSSFQKFKTGSTNKTLQTKEAGIKNETDFPDTAEGILELNDGSVTMEGTHQLIREGGPSQTVYLTSSVVDLSNFEGKKVQIMGETFSSQTAGWFMDVGWVKVIE